MGQPCVLVIDDSVQLRDAYRVVLEASGFRVIAAASGREALEHLHGGLLPDVILLDLTMPAMSGWEFRAIQRADSRLSGIPVVVASGDELEPAEADLLATCSIFRKSARIDELLAAVFQGPRCRQCLQDRMQAAKCRRTAKPYCASNPRTPSASASHPTRSVRARSL